jgi:lysozyme family protein
MAKFAPAVTALLQEEGGYVEDHAGPTKYGITLPRLLEEPEHGDIDGDGDIDADDIRALSQEEAEAIYHRQWWRRYQYGQIVDQGVANKVLSLSVNMGPWRAHRVLQRSANVVYGAGLVEDGYIGPKTLRGVNGGEEGWRLMARMRYEAWQFYEDLLARRREFEVYRNGWVIRAMA